MKMQQKYILHILFQMGFHSFGRGGTISSRLCVSVPCKAHWRKLPWSLGRAPEATTWRKNQTKEIGSAREELAKPINYRFHLENDLDDYYSIQYCFWLRVPSKDLLWSHSSNSINLWNSTFQAYKKDNDDFRLIIILARNLA